MDSETRKSWAYLTEMHKESCSEMGEHPDEVDTPYSVGADAIERLAAMDGK
jgi:hypothetical protein